MIGTSRRTAPDLAGAAERIAERGGALGRPLYVLDETTSTNDEAKHGARAGAVHGSTWVAETQTAGRGRQGRTWVSPRGENLLFSVLWRAPCPPARLPLLSLAAGIAVCEAARMAAPGRDIRIKWPNDIVLASRSSAGLVMEKLAGILVETSSIGGAVRSRTVDAIVIGIGINVHTREFPGDLAMRATSLARIASHPVDRAEVLVNVLALLDRSTTLVAARGLGLLRASLDAWDALRGERVESELGSGVASGFDDEGRLLVTKADGSIAAWKKAVIARRSSTFVRPCSHA